MKNIYDISPLIKVKKSDLFDLNPMIIKVNSIDEESADKFSSDVSKAHNTGQDIIPVIINSFGGDVYALLSMISTMSNSNVPIATICIGKAMSAGAILLACGTNGYRYCDKNASIMIHDVLHSTHGKNEEIKAEAKHTDKLQKQIFGLMANKCNKEKNYFLDLIHEKGHVEMYLTPNEAKKHGIIDKIKVPSLKTTVSVNIVLD